MVLCKRRKTRTTWDPPASLGLQRARSADPTHPGIHAAYLAPHSENRKGSRGSRATRGKPQHEREQNKYGRKSLKGPIKQRMGENILGENTAPIKNKGSYKKWEQEILLLDGDLKYREMIFFLKKREFKYWKIRLRNSPGKCDKKAETVVYPGTGYYSALKMDKPWLRATTSMNHKTGQAKVVKQKKPPKNMRQRPQVAHKAYSIYCLTLFRKFDDPCYREKK